VHFTFGAKSEIIENAKVGGEQKKRLREQNKLWNDLAIL
jgi:hypothetical protein